MKIGHNFTISAEVWKPLTSPIGWNKQTLGNMYFKVDWEAAWTFILEEDENWEETQRVIREGKHKMKKKES